MAWNLAAANVADDARSYLSVLASHGDEHAAMSECGVTEAQVRAWSRDDEFLTHRQCALAYFREWRDWTPGGYAERLRRGLWGRHAEPGASGFHAIEDMSPAALAEANAQQGVRPGTRQTGVFSAAPAGALTPEEKGRWGV